VTAEQVSGNMASRRRLWRRCSWLRRPTLETREAKHEPAAWPSSAPPGRSRPPKPSADPHAARAMITKTLNLISIMSNAVYQLRCWRAVGVDGRVQALTGGSYDALRYAMSTAILYCAVFGWIAAMKAAWTSSTPKTLVT
jgi:hypothetical protein